MSGRAIHRILFIRTDRIGDVLMNLPAIRCLRQNYPKAWITLLADRAASELLREQADLDEILTVDARSFARSWRGCVREAARLRTARFDLAVASNPDKYLHVLVFLAGIPKRLGHAQKWPFLLTHARRSSPDVRHEIDRNLETVRPFCPEPWDGVWSLPRDERAEARVGEWMREQELAGQKLLLVHPGTTNPLKRWEESRFAGFCRSAAAQFGVRIVLVGGADEEGSARRILRGSGGSALTLAGRTTLRELVALIRRPETQGLVSSDSGPAHLGWILRKPAVIFFSSEDPGSDPARWGPRDAASRWVRTRMAELTVERALALTREALLP